MVARSRSGNNLHFAWARCRLTVPGWQPAVKSFLISSIWVCGWCFGGSCSSATSAVAKASVMTHPSWPVIPCLGISPSPRLVSAVNRATSEQNISFMPNFHMTTRAVGDQRKDDRGLHARGGADGNFGARAADALTVIVRANKSGLIVRAVGAYSQDGPNSSPEANRP